MNFFFFESSPRNPKWSHARGESISNRSLVAPVNASLPVGATRAEPVP